MKKKEKIEFSYSKSLKSLDTEETLDLMFYRPIGFFWAKLAYRLGVTPNAITIASIFIGIGSGVCFFFGSFHYWWNILAAFLLILANSFDSADGQLARITHQYSRLGRILDGLSGDIWFAAIYAAICLRENITSEFFSAHHWVIWVVAAGTGFFHATQAAMADYYRQFHLYFVKGKEGSELDNAADLWEKFHSLSWRKNFWQKLVLMFYTNYTTGQEKRTPWMQRLRKVLKSRFGDDVPTPLREEFREKSKPLMKYTNMLSFNTRTIALFVAILIFQMPWLYFAFELTVLNIMLVYMMWRHERICREFIREAESFGG